MIAAVFVFLLGYAGIIFEHKFFDKAATAILTGIICWALFFIFGEGSEAIKMAALSEHLGDISQVVFFIMGAMLIVEVIDTHKGFEFIEKLMKIRSRTLIFWLLIASGFFLSSILDNLTTIIVMISLFKKLIPERSDRLFLSASLVAVVNAGGAWTPIGDITTTMLWIADRITTVSIMKTLFIPSVVSALIIGLFVKNKIKIPTIKSIKQEKEEEPYSILILVLGILALVMVPLLKALIGLPPFMGILFGVGILWGVTDIIHFGNSKAKHLRIQQILPKIDFSVIMFFLGILLAVDALESFGALKTLAAWVKTTFPSENLFAAVLGILSAIVDNVPLVAATIRMFGLDLYPQDHHLWNMLSFCVGVGGSILVIGSAPGIALMSLEKVNFTWYFKHMSLVVLISYIIGTLIAAVI